MKRFAAGVLWALVVAWIGSYITMFTGLPTAFGLLVGLTAGSLVALDPWHRIWTHGAAATVAARGADRSSGVQALEPAHQR